MIDILRLTPTHAAQYRALMLQTYADAPGAYIATVAEREHLPMEFWEARVSAEADAAEMVFGALDGDRLVGAAGLRLQRRPRTRHKGWLFGMTVVPECRGQGVGRGLVEAVLGQARSTPGLRVVQLSVAEPNTAAIGLYESCGFVAFGTEPFAFKAGEEFVADVHMWCDVGGSAL